MIIERGPGGGNADESWSEASGKRDVVGRALTLVQGCTRVSAGCDHCWLAGMEHRFKKQPGLTSGGRWTGVILTRGDLLGAALRRRKPTTYAVWSDLFHEGVQTAFIHMALRQMEGTPRHTFLILTKRPRRMSEIVWHGAQPRNVWHGVSCEDQGTRDGRMSLLAEGLPRLFLSIEPLLGSVDLSKILPGNIRWVIVGAESGPKRRPCKTEWVRSIVQQCAESGVPVFVKQLHDAAGRVIHDLAEFPDDLRRREFPQ